MNVKNYLLVILYTVLAVFALLVVGSLLGCNNVVDSGTGQSTYMARAKEIKLVAVGEPFVSTEMMLNPTFGESVTFEFEGFTDADTTDYICQLTLCGYKDGNWEVVRTYSGGDYINGVHADGFINQWEDFKLFASLWTDDVEPQGTATLKVSNINIY